jgi:histidinol-phosphate aminotransferase
VLDYKGYVPGKPVEEVKRELGLEDVIKMASNENPLGTSPLAMAAMMEELRAQAHRYPESRCPKLVRRLAEVHDVPPELVYVDNGEDAVITMLGVTFLDPGDEVVFGAVTFPAYVNVATKMGAVPVPVPMTADYRLDVDAFIDAVSPRTKMLFVCNPNNPTGTFVTREEVDRLLDAVPSDVLVVLDEAYAHFADHPDYPHGPDYLADHPNLVVLRTFSKVLGLAGMRVGYALAHPDVVELMLRLREPFPVNRVAQAGAVAALDDVDFLERTVALVRRGRERFYRAFDELGLSYPRSQANFVCVDLDRPAHPVFEALLRRGVIVRPLAPYGLPQALRVTVGTEEENERTVVALQQTLEGERVSCEDSHLRGVTP